MATIKFLIQSKNDTAGIYVRLKEGRSIDIKAKTKFIIDSKDWSDVKGHPKNLKDENFKSLNNDLVTFKSALLSHYNKTGNKLEINTQWLKDFINPPKENTEISNRLTEYFDYYVLHKRNEIGLASVKKLKVVKRIIERFEKETNTEYLIKDFNSNLKLRFEQYCSKESYSPNTIARAINFIKTICYHARTNGIETHFQLDSLTTKYLKVEKLYLDLNEIQQIEKANLPTPSLENARDWLLISCETGQRVSDFLRFTKEQIRYENGKALIEFTQVKTNKIMTVPLSKKVMSVLKKRKGEFPKTISDQKYNDYIKEVCQMAGLTQKVKGSIVEVIDKKNKIKRKKAGTFEKWELVTSHIGRRSFATNNYGRIPTSLLIGATGHSTEKQFLEYIGKTDTQKAMQLAEYF